MNAGETIELLVNAENYNIHRLKISDSFIEMMEFMFNEKFKLIEQKEKDYQELILLLKG
jgi:hypothetical protein